MARFISSYVFCLILLCLFMQKPLAEYLQNTYHTDFGLNLLAQNKDLAKFGIFYDLLKYTHQNLVAKFSPPIAPKKQNLEPNLALPTEQIVEILPAPTQILEQNLTQHVANLPEILPEPKTLESKKIAETSNEIVLNSGDEVLFIGDSIMQPIALHTKKILAKSGIKSTDLSRHSTGLVNKKYYDWQAVCADTLAQNTNIKLIIALLGANDPWGRTIEGKYQEFGSEGWAQFYSARVGEIYEVAQNAGVQVIWLGVPCMKKAAYGEKMQRLNEIFKASSEAYASRYFGLSELVCEEGNYTAYRKNDKGKNVKIRSDDGIHINMEGSRLVATGLADLIKVRDENATK